MGSFVGIELMGYNVNNYLKVIVVQKFNCFEAVFIRNLCLYQKL